VFDGLGVALRIARRLFRRNCDGKMTSPGVCRDQVKALLLVQRFDIATVNVVDHALYLAITLFNARSLTSIILRQFKLVRCVGGKSVGN
jgi:hypothetical protein